MSWYESISFGFKSKSQIYCIDFNLSEREVFPKFMVITSELRSKLVKVMHENLLDFLLEEIDPSIYNQTVRDTREQIQLRVQELDIEIYEGEFNY
jgi:uncharacterized protein (DUF2164 family)